MEGKIKDIYLKTGLRLIVVTLVLATILRSTASLPKLGIGIELAQTLSSATLLVGLTGLTAYVLSRLEQILEILERYKSNFNGNNIELLKNIDSLYGKMIDLTLGCDEVYTQMYAESPEKIGGKMEEYFDKITREIAKGKIRFYRIFNLGRIGDEPSKWQIKKLEWILRTINKLYGKKNFFLYYQELDSEKLPNFGTHLVKRNGNYYLFLLNHIEPAKASGFLISDDRVGDLAERTYMTNLSRSIRIVEGKKLNIDKLTQLVELFGLAENSDYKEILSKEN